MVDGAGSPKVATVHPQGQRMIRHLQNLGFHIACGPSKRPESKSTQKDQHQGGAGRKGRSHQRAVDQGGEITCRLQGESSLQVKGTVPRKATAGDQDWAGDRVPAQLSILSGMPFLLQPFNDKFLRSRHHMGISLLGTGLDSSLCDPGSLCKSPTWARGH